MLCFKNNMKKKLFFCFNILLLVVSFSYVILFIHNKDDIDYILKTADYSYLPLEAQNYIKDVYKETGEVILTERNKKENMVYLNPLYVEYLELDIDERDNVELIPDAYILDYSINQDYTGSMFPTSYDLRNVDGYNFVSPIKDQGTTSVCWAFASVSNVETLYMKNNNQSYGDTIPKFSIRQMDYITATDYLALDGNWSSGICTNLNCTWTPWKNLDNGNHELGDGGNFYASSIAMANGITLTDESVMPWHEEKRPVLVNDIYGYDKSLYEVDSAIYMPTIMEYSVSNDLINSYVNDIKKYMISYGGPFVGTYSPKSTCGFENVDGTKVLKTDDCISNKLNEDMGHAMQIIGWNDDYEYSYCEYGTNHYSVNSNGTCSKGELVSGTGAWILRNSWGVLEEGFKEYSYVYLTYDSTRLSIGFVTSISDMKTRTWDNNYHSNPWIGRKISNGMLSVNKQIKEFNTYNNNLEKVEKIKFLTSSKNGKYNISILTKNKEYNNIGEIITTEVGIYTVDLSDMDIILDDKLFSVKIEGENGVQFYNDSISVFTSNVIDDTYAITYSNKAYDELEPLSYKNPLYIDLDFNDYRDIYSWNVTINSYVKNMPQFDELSYRLRKNDIVVTSFGDSEIYYDGDIGVAKFYGISSVSNSKFNLKDELGSTWIMEIVYNEEIINSFPIKFNVSSNKSNSNVRLYVNNGTDYYYDYSAVDRQVSYFYDLTGNKDFYNNGYYISSWNTKSDGSGISYDTVSGVNVYHDMELYAIWSNEKVNAKVIYTGQDDNCLDCIKGNMESQFYGYDEIIEFPINKFVKDGYVFKNWKIQVGNSILNYYEQEEMELKISQILEYPIFNNSEIIVYGTWTDDYITIEFNSNGGTGNMSSINIELYSDDLMENRIKDNLFIRDGYTFVGWNTKADGSGISYKNNECVKFNENLTLYAQWVENENVVTFNSNDGKNSIVTQQVPDNISTKLMENIFSRDGYKFGGWNINADGSGMLYVDGEEININDDLILYAQWIPVTYKLTFNSNGGIGTMEDQVFTYDVSSVLDDLKFSKDGYIFKEWNTKADGTGYSYNNKESIKISGNITLFAIWVFGTGYKIDKYLIDESNKYIDLIDVNTTREEFLKNIILSNDYTVMVECKTINGVNLLYTGGKTKIYKDGELYIEYTNIVRGDVNGNATVDIIDYIRIMKDIMNTTKLTGEYLSAADVNQNNKIDIIDYIRIMKMIMEEK